MSFDDEQTEGAIRVISAVQQRSGQPLPAPEQLRDTEKRAAAGDGAAAEELLAARLRLIYPTLPQPPYSGERALLWQSIVSGRYEGIAWRRVWITPAPGPICREREKGPPWAAISSAG